LACEDPPKGEDLKAVPKSLFLKERSAQRLYTAGQFTVSVCFRGCGRGERFALITAMRAELAGGVESSRLSSATLSVLPILFARSRKREGFERYTLSHLG